MTFNAFVSLVMILVFILLMGILAKRNPEDAKAIVFVFVVLTVGLFLTDRVITDFDIFPPIEEKKENITDNGNSIVEDKDGNKYLIVYDDNGKPVIVETEE